MHSVGGHKGAFPNVMTAADVCGSFCPDHHRNSVRRRAAAVEIRPVGVAIDLSKQIS